MPQTLLGGMTSQTSTMTTLCGIDYNMHARFQQENGQQYRGVRVSFNRAVLDLCNQWRSYGRAW